MMSEISLVGVLIVAAVAFVVPLALGLVPILRIPSVVVEIVAGIVIGPAVLGVVEVDAPLRFMALLGLAFLLFLAGTEIDLGGLLRGGALRSAVAGFTLSLVIAFGLASLLGVVGLIGARCWWRSCSRPPRWASSSRCSPTQGRAAPSWGN